MFFLLTLLLPKYSLNGTPNFPDAKNAFHIQRGQKPLVALSCEIFIWKWKRMRLQLCVCSWSNASAISPSTDLQMEIGKWIRFRRRKRENLPVSQATCYAIVCSVHRDSSSRSEVLAAGTSKTITFPSLGFGRPPPPPPTTLVLTVCCQYCIWYGAK